MTAREKFSAAKLLEETGDWEKAEKAYQELTSLSGKISVQASRRRAACLMHLQRWEDMRSEVDRVFNADTQILDADISRRLIVQSYERNQEEAYRTIETHIARRLENTPEGAGKDGHIILTAAAPKTGSTSLATALAAALGAERTSFLCFQTFSVSRGLPSIPSLNLLRGTNIVNHCHLAPDPGFMEQLRKMPWVRVAVHFRHPADTILSVVDMVLRRRAPIMLMGEPRLVGADPDYVMKWALDRYLPDLLTWMQDWLNYVDAGHPSILGLTTMAQMKALGQDEMVKQLLQKAKLPYCETFQSLPKRTKNRLTGDAKVEYTTEQRAHVQRAIPRTLADRFGWT